VSFDAWYIAPTTAEPSDETSNAALPVPPKRPSGVKVTAAWEFWTETETMIAEK
jgi:hypothetical protein